MKTTAVLEAVLFAVSEPLPLRRLAELTGIDDEELRSGLDELSRELDQPGRGIRLVEVAGGYQLRTSAEARAAVSRAVQSRPLTLSQPALETLAVIAYRQPVTRSEIEAVRGVRVDHAVATLQARGLVRSLGRDTGPGRPILYGTTPLFLEWCGLNDLDDLPPLVDDELIRGDGTGTG